MSKKLSAFLVRQFKTTHHKTEWFVPLRTAVKGLTEKEARKKVKPDISSIFEIVAHLVYWNERYLKKMKKEPLIKRVDKNDLTFTASKEKSWAALCRKAESVFGEWSRHLDKHPPDNEEELEAIGHTNTHNAYHIGQIVLLRKLMGNWKSADGVK